MKYLIFSDSHLTPRFDRRKFIILKEAIEQADRVIINGDFWEGFNTKFDDFVTSEWSTTLFPLLKKKKAVYLYGNHDKKSASDNRTSLFSDAQDYSFTFKSGKHTYRVEHGDRLIKLPDLSFLTLAFLETVEDILTKVFGKLFLQTVYGRLNKKIKKDTANSLKPNEFLVTGHTHCAEIDLKSRYINDGFIKHRIAQYIFIENGAVTAVSKKY